jgi:hypothetical protein
MTNKKNTAILAPFGCLAEVRQNGGVICHEGIERELPLAEVKVKASIGRLARKFRRSVDP